MVLVKNLKIFHLFIFGKISQQNVFDWDNQGDYGDWNDWDYKDDWMAWMTGMIWTTKDDQGS